VPGPTTAATARRRALYLAALLFIASTLTLGLVISTLARTQFQAFQLAFFIMLPSILLSGFMFPFDGMPKPAQWIAQVLPLTHFNELVRGIVPRGAPIGDLGRPPLTSRRRRFRVRGRAA
jgi:ABC-2 type transport system permease protein